MVGLIKRFIFALCLFQWHPATKEVVQRSVSQTIRYWRWARPTPPPYVQLIVNQGMMLFVLILFILVLSIYIFRQCQSGLADGTQIQQSHVQLKVHTFCPLPSNPERLYCESCLSDRYIDATGWCLNCERMLLNIQLNTDYVTNTVPAYASLWHSCSKPWVSKNCQWHMERDS